MRLSSLIVLAFVVAAADTLDAQAAPAPKETRHWSFPFGYGPIATDGSGARLLVSHAEGGSMSVQRRLGESRWWIGVEFEYWSSTATREGVDSLVARSKVEGVYAGSGADFESFGWAVAAQYNAWRSDRFAGYVLASVGGNGQAGYIHGLCSVSLGPCEIPGTYVPGRATHPMGAAGLGVRMRLFDGDAFWRWIPQQAFAEARIANQGGQDGRITTVPLRIGLSW